jgi:hypothetical protein
LADHLLVEILAVIGVPLSSSSTSDGGRPGRIADGNSHDHR